MNNSRKLGDIDVIIIPFIKTKIYFDRTSFYEIKVYFSR